MKNILKISLAILFLAAISATSWAEDGSSPYSDVDPTWGVKALAQQNGDGQQKDLVVVVLEKLSEGTSVSQIMKESLDQGVASMDIIAALIAADVPMEVIVAAANMNDIPADIITAALEGTGEDVLGKSVPPGPGPKLPTKHRPPTTHGPEHPIPGPPPGETPPASSASL